MSAPKKFLGQAMPIPAAPLVNPATGVVTDVWLSFLTTLFTRTGGPAPLAATLPQVVAQAEGTAQGSLLAVIGDAFEPLEGPEHGALLAALLADAEPVFPLPIPPATLISPLLASAAVSGHRALMWDASGGGVVHADPSSATYAFAGISQGAAAAGAAVQVVEAGLLAEPSWTWTPRLPVYAGADGALTQAVPATGTLHQVGVAASATSVLVQPLYSIIRK